MSHEEVISKLWRIMDYLRERPQGSFSVIEDGVIFAHSVRCLREAIKTLSV